MSRCQRLKEWLLEELPGECGWIWLDEDDLGSAPTLFGLFGRLEEKPKSKEKFK